MVLAYDHRQLRETLNERLRTAPTEWISSQNQLVCFLVFDAEWTYQHQHKILFVPDEWTANDIRAYRGELFTTTRWEFAAELIVDADLDRKQPTGNQLEKTIGAYTLYH